MPIVILDESVANKIAAGEVIERPASVVKELLENSIDAGASRISVQVADGGRSLIRVTDDGCGMNRQDAVLSLQRHSTSKIRTADDLAHITTLGFRGEALPSIAAVSRLEILTRQPNAEEGVRLTAEGGTITDLSAAGAPGGTRVSVMNLFYNTPARLKFLRSEATELSHIADLVGRYALAYPHISLILEHNGRELLNRAGGEDLSGALLALYGRRVLEETVPVEWSLPSATVRGLVSRPSLNRASRQAEHFLVNRRPIRSRLLSRALEEAYRGLLPAGRYPVAVLLLEVEPHLVDVNVHPAKAEVRFAREGEVFQGVLAAVKEALRVAQTSFSSPALPTLTPGPQRLAAPLSRTPRQWAEQRLPIQPGLAAAGPRLSLIGQWEKTYILAESSEGLVVIYQHRAHERVLYERLEQSLSPAPAAQQHLVAPITLEFSPAEAAVLGKHMPVFERLGFLMEPFGRGTFLLRAVPALLERLGPEKLMKDLVEELTAEARASSDPLAAVLAGLSCHAAVRAGDALGREEMERLLHDLARTSQPFLCPHGSPVLITLPQAELDRKFMR